MINGYLVTYDIRDPKRLRSVAKLLEGYGARKQYSIFYCRLNKRELERLRWELTKITATEDDLLFIPLCTHCTSRINHSHQKEDWGKVEKFEIV